MKEEIKEIIECANKVVFNEVGMQLDTKQVKTLLDYITNLQKENKIQKEKIEHLLIDLRGESEYKQRNEKAIEYMNEAIESDSFTTLPSGKITDIEYCIVAFEDLLNILKDDKDE